MRVPRLGFLGVGWIGRHRMEAVAGAGAGVVAAIADASPEMRAEALEVAPDATAVAGLESLLELDLDGVVIATPSALHAAQSIAVLERGLPVFCQKPLGRDADETRAVVAAARRVDRLLHVDLSYRHTAALRRVRELVRSGDLGDVYAAELVFHNAYGPDKAWFYDRSQSGGGCVIDLGIHLADALLWCLDFPPVAGVSSRLFAGGRRLPPRPEQVEDFAQARLELAGGAVASLACSWKLPAGQDAVIAVELYGTRGAAVMRNVDGSFYDFVAERFRGTARERLVDPPDAWGGRAVVAWAEHLARDPRFDPEAERLVTLAEVLDAVYGRPGPVRREA